MLTVSKTPSLNDLGERWAKMKWRNKYRKELALYGLLYGQKKIKRKRHIIITRYSNASKLLDYDNLVGGCKQLIDCLKREKIIVDDSKDWLKCEYREVRCSKTDEKTTIEIKDIDVIEQYREGCE